jgi:ribose/xylose/arabinose/galactoside ABC-type transport system permease subunit
VLRFVLNNGILIALILEVIIFGLLIPTEVFFSSLNIINILRMCSGVGILATCYAIALIAGVIDFSYLGTMSLAAIVFAWLFQVLGWPLWAAGLVSLGFSVGLALFSALLITKARVISIVATIGVSLISVAVAYFIMFAVSTEGYIRTHRLDLRSVVGAQVAGITLVIPLAAVVFIVAYVMLNYTKLGAHLYAVGGNPQAAVLNGINRNRLITLVLLGVAVGGWTATMYTVGRTLYATIFNGAFGMSAAGAKQGAVFVNPDPFVASLFAGIALFGGAGKLDRLVFALLFLGVLSSGMGLLNVSAAARVTVDGAAFVFAVLLEGIRQRIESR